MQTAPKFGKLRSLFLPVGYSELAKFLPMVFMIFLIAANYNMLKIVKDSTVVPLLGAEVIPFVKVWMMLPMAVLMTAFFSSLVRRLGETSAFYIVISTFLLYFFTFVFIIYPNKQIFDLDTLANLIDPLLPNGWSGFSAMVRNWHLCVFYTMCEIWGTTVLFVLFWGFANKVIGLEEAKRFYPLFGLAGNSSGIVAPMFFQWAGSTSLVSSDRFGSDWERTLTIICAGVLLNGLVTIAIYYYLNRSLVSRHSSKEESQDLPESSSKEKKKEPVSFLKGLKVLAKMPYVRNLTILVLCYNVIINLTEIIWKDQIRSLYPNSLEYGLYFGKVMMVTGIIASISDLFVCSNVIRRFGWTPAAMVSPVIIFATSVGFFGFLTFDSIFESLLVHAVGLSPLALTVFFGSTQNALARAAKYSFFDASKEIAFIPLDSQSRIQAKAAIDGVCSRLGKSGGSFVYQGMLAGLGSLAACVPYVCGLVFVLVFVWTRSILLLGREFNRLTSKNSLQTKSHDPREPGSKLKVSQGV